MKENFEEISEEVSELKVSDNEYIEDKTKREEEEKIIKEKLETYDGPLNMRKKISLNYTEFDTQKGSLSPRWVFKRKKNDGLDLNVKLTGNETKSKTIFILILI